MKQIRVEVMPPCVEDLGCNNKAKSILTRAALTIPNVGCFAICNDRWLVSYETVVAVIDRDGQFHLLNPINTNTTARHVNTFIDRYMPERIDWRKLPVEHGLADRFVQYK